MNKTLKEVILKRGGKKRILTMVVYACNTSIEEAEQKWRELEASPDYVVNPRWTWAT